MPTASCGRTPCLLNLLPEKYVSVPIYIFSYLCSCIPTYVREQTIQVAKAVHDTRNRDETKPLNDLHTGKALLRVEGGFIFFREIQ